MSEKFLHREDAPFSDEVWSRIDAAVVEAAKGRLSARRLLHVEGPYGLGLKALPGPDAPAGAGSAEEAEVVASRAVPLALIRSGFTLSMRDVAAFEQQGTSLDLGAAVQAAIACARREDELIFKGSQALGVHGLLTAEGTRKAKLSSWEKVGAAVEDLIGAVSALDEVGFHGPYALALAPSRYNALFRRYNQGNMTELEHLRSLVTDGIIKTPAVEEGGVLLASGRQCGAIVLGQDMMTGFIGPAGGQYELAVSESLALRLLRPEAACVLK